MDLFIKKVPKVVKTLISREAVDNRRSINQEAIALLEEALMQRSNTTGSRRRQMQAVLEAYVDGPRPVVPAAVPHLSDPASDATASA